MKISVIMPTYNDCKSIEETLDSLKNQTYKNWELVIVDDGSIDDTKKVINRYIENNNLNKKIKYIYQENGDQLNAILNGMNYLSGDYIYLLHSDDLLASNEVFEKCVKCMEKHPEYDAITADLIIIDEQSNEKKIQKLKKYKKKDYILAIQELWLGRNLYVDFAFHRAESFFNQVQNNYVIWNTPYWIDFNQSKPEMLNIGKVDFNILKYRVHQGNYVNNYKGKLNVINGELRTLTSLMKFYDIPCYQLQYYIFRTFNKLNLFSIYRPIYKNKCQAHRGNVVEFVIKKRFGEQYIENRFLKVLVDFYKNDNNRTIKIEEEIDQKVVYEGKDNAKFNNALLENKLNNIYTYILNEMEIGFNKVVVKDNMEKEKIEKILRFLCINYFVDVIVEENN